MCRALGLSRSCHLGYGPTELNGIGLRTRIEMNPTLSLGCRVQPGESESELQLLRGSERDLKVEGDTRCRVERVMTGLGWDA